MDKVYVIEERSGFRGWRAVSVDTIKKASDIKIVTFRKLSEIYRLSKYYRIKTYTSKEV